MPKPALPVVEHLDVLEHIGMTSAGATLKRIKNIKEQQQAQATANKGDGSGSAQAPSSPSPSQAPAPKPSAGISFVVNNPTFLSGSPKEADEFFRTIKKGLERIADRS